MANLGARAAAAFGVEAAFNDLCMTSLSKFGQKQFVREGVQMVKEIAKDTLVSEVMDMAGFGPPPTVSRVSALSSIATGGVKAAFKETSTMGLGKAIGEQKQAYNIQPFHSASSLTGIVSSAFGGLASMCYQAPVNPSFAHAPSMARPSPSQPPSFSGSVMNAFARGPSAMPLFQQMMPTFTTTASPPQTFLPSFQPTRGAGGFMAPKFNTEPDPSLSGTRKNKM